MVPLLIAYGLYLILFFGVSYAIVYHLTNFRVEGDKSSLVMWLYIIVAIVIVVGSILLLRPI
jgi:hypothetical protein